MLPKYTESRCYSTTIDVKSLSKAYANDFFSFGINSILCLLARVENNLGDKLARIKDYGVACGTYLSRFLTEQYEGV